VFCARLHYSFFSRSFAVYLPIFAWYSVASDEMNNTHISSRRTPIIELRRYLNFSCVVIFTGHTSLKKKLLITNTGHTQKNGTVSIVIPIETAPFSCVCPV
jgi:hypothetical protein